HAHLLIPVFLSTPPPTTELYTLSLHDALPIWLPSPSPTRDSAPRGSKALPFRLSCGPFRRPRFQPIPVIQQAVTPLWNLPLFPPDRKSTRLNSSHVKISYAVFCLKKKR